MKLQHLFAVFLIAVSFTFVLYVAFDRWVVDLIAPGALNAGLSVVVALAITAAVAGTYGVRH